MSDEEDLRTFVAQMFGTQADPPADTPPDPLDRIPPDDAERAWARALFAPGPPAGIETQLDNTKETNR